MKIIVIFVLISFVLVGCKGSGKETQAQSNKEGKTFNIVTTTSMITDLVNNIGGDKVVVEGLMGAGVDPHLYKASEGDVSKLYNANLIFYNGLHLEGKLVDVFSRMEKQNINAIAVSDALIKESLISSKLFKSNYDPHIWFDIGNWERITLFVADKLSSAMPENKDFFQSNAQDYLNELKLLKVELSEEIESLPAEKRRLVTAHDAFNYFGKSFGFDVVGLQGISTTTEAGVQDVQETAAYIIKHKVKAVFIESSVPRRTVEALEAAVNSKDHKVVIGGTLFSDALGDSGTDEGTYIGMFRYNVQTIVNALK